MGRLLVFVAVMSAAGYGVYRVMYKGTMMAVSPGGVPANERLKNVREFGKRMEAEQQRRFDANPGSQAAEGEPAQAP